MMSVDELRELEANRRKALWTLGGLPPGDPRASDALLILDAIDLQEQNNRLHTVMAPDLKGVRDAVPVQQHHCGIDIIFEHVIPQPWRERFSQASIGSTRLAEGPYARDWEKFLSSWEAEMRHWEAHKTARTTPKSDC
ncbi:hypothetical protein [Pseudomonas coronafaciens]|uniref:hypothetical protein n=1 Tax=Pseudomonas coronafaciens TaxID=53409 RepID=UPI002E101664